MDLLFRWHHQLRWGARLGGLVAFAAVGLYLARGAVDLHSRSSLVIFTGLIWMAIIAYIVAWHWETAGGTSLALLGVMNGGFGFAFAIQNPFEASLALGLPLFAAGLLFVLAGEYDWVSRER